MGNNEDLNAVLVGSVCTNVTRFGPESWRFEFGQDTTLDVRCPWRIVADGRIALGNADDGQQFGLPTPVDGTSEATRLLAQPVVTVAIREDTSDIVIQLGNNVSLEVFNSSSGYEGWECASSNGLLAIASAGGELQIYHTDPPLK